MVKENTMKQTEIGIIPEEWKLKKLGNIAFITKLAGFEYSKYFNSYKTGGEIIVVRGTNITNNKLDLSDTKYIPKTTSDFLHRSKLSKGDLVFAYVGTIGPIYLINEDDRFHLGPNTAKIKIEDKEVNTDYILNYFLSEYIRKEIEDRISVGAQPSLSMTKIRDFSIPIPTLPEQEAIANALSDADVWIESLQRLIAKKRLIKQGAMQELLVPNEDWEIKKLGKVIDVYRGGSPRPIQNFMTDKLEGINWIKIGDTSSSGKYIVSANEKILPEGENYSRRVYPGDFLLSNSMSFGRPYILKIDGCIHDGWLVLQNYSSSFNTEFLYYLLTSKYIIDQYKSKAAGSSVLNLNKELVSTVELIIPSLTEQTRIATILSDMDTELETLESQLAKARQIKQGMMQELLTGRTRLI